MDVISTLSAYSTCITVATHFDDNLLIVFEYALQHGEFWQNMKLKIYEKSKHCMTNVQRFVILSVDNSETKALVFEQKYDWFVNKFIYS